MYYMYIEDVLFPITPAKITYKIGNKNKTVTLINEGEVNLIKTPGLTDIQIDELILPVQKYPFALYENNEYKNVEYFLNKLEGWKKRKDKPVSFKLTRCESEESLNNLIDKTTNKTQKTRLIKLKKLIKNGKKFWNTHFDVTIENYEIIEDADKYGMDVCIKLTMKQYRNWGIKQLKIKKKSSGKASATKNKTRKNTKTISKYYTVKKGDCLYNIAKKELNNASRWKEIYTLNKKTIESVAKKNGRKSSSNGHWIYPGTKLKLPK